MSRPSGRVLLVFAIAVLIGGSNFVAARFSNRELAPFWGAGLRFGIAGVYFGTSTGQVYASPNGGDSWGAIASNLPPVLSVEVQVLR